MQNVAVDSSFSDSALPLGHATQLDAIHKVGGAVDGILSFYDLEQLDGITCEKTSTSMGSELTSTSLNIWQNCPIYKNPPWKNNILHGTKEEPCIVLLQCYHVFMYNED